VLKNFKLYQNISLFSKNDAITIKKKSHFCNCFQWQKKYLKKMILSRFFANTSMNKRKRPYLFLVNHVCQKKKNDNASHFSIFFSLASLFAIFKRYIYLTDFLYQSSVTSHTLQNVQ
jgi:hypothetical protein